MIKFFILAAGLGKRARPLSLIEPKPLFPLDGTPLIHLILDQLAQKRVVRGFINLHYKARRMNDFLVKHEDITFFHETKLSGSKILNRAADFLKDDYLLVINGDIFLDIPIHNLIDKITEHKADGVLLVKRDSTRKYASLLHEQDRYSGVGAPVSAGVIYCGVALFRHSVVECIKEQNFFQTLEKYNFNIRIVYYDGLWLDIGDPKSYFRSNFLYKKHINADHKSNSFSKQVEISSDSKVSHSIIWKNTQILNKTRISNSIVTGNIVLDHLNYNKKIITENAIYDL